MKTRQTQLHSTPKRVKSRTRSGKSKTQHRVAGDRSPSSPLTVSIRVYLKPAKAAAHPPACHLRRLRRRVTALCPFKGGRISLNGVGSKPSVTSDMSLSLISRHQLQLFRSLAISDRDVQISEILENFEITGISPFFLSFPKKCQGYENQSEASCVNCLNCLL